MHYELQNIEDIHENKKTIHTSYIRKIRHTLQQEMDFLG